MRSQSGQDAGVSWPPGAPSKAELRDRLRAAHPWLDDERFGPQTVDAGECENCGEEARLVQTCGPPSAAQLGRACALAAGTDAWCEGHEEEAAAALAWLRRLPPDADQIARVWWLATGEVRLGSAGQRVIAALEEHQRVGAPRSLGDGQDLPDDE